MIRPTSVLLYGLSGSSKTSQLYHMARYILKRNPGKKIRMFHSDGGGYAPFVDSGMIERHDVEILDYSASSVALADLRKVSEGYWPRWVLNGKAQYHPSEGSMRFFQKHEACKVQEKEWEGLAGFFIEGLTSVAETLKNHCSDQTEGIGFKESWKYTEEEYTIVGLQQGHYNMVQKEMHARHHKGFAIMPVPWLICTALVGKGEDKQSRETIYGPQVAGTAQTDKVPSWFNHCFHINLETYDDIPSKLNPKAGGERKTGMVAWFERHPDTTTSVPCLAKCTVLPEMYLELKRYFPYGFVPLDFNNGITTFFIVLDKLRKDFMAQTKGTTE